MATINRLMKKIMKDLSYGKPICLCESLRIPKGDVIGHNATNLEKIITHY